MRKHDLVASRLSPHHEVHALGVLLYVEEALGHWDEVRRLQDRVERAVAANQGTPCVLNAEDALLVCRRLWRARSRRRGAATRGPTAAAQGFGGVDVGYLARPAAGPSGVAARRPRTARRPARVVRRDVALVVGRQPLRACDEARRTGRARPAEEAEEAAVPLLQPGTYLEPFALRTLGVVRSDRALTEQAVERFDAMGLRWHAAKTVIAR